MVEEKTPPGKPKKPQGGADCGGGWVGRAWGAVEGAWVVVLLWQEEEVERMLIEFSVLLALPWVTVPALPPVET